MTLFQRFSACVAVVSTKQSETEISKPFVANSLLLFSSSLNCHDDAVVIILSQKRQRKGMNVNSKIEKI